MCNNCPAKRGMYALQHVCKIITSSGCRVYRPNEVVQEGIQEGICAGGYSHRRVYVQEGIKE